MAKNKKVPTCFVWTQKQGIAELSAFTYRDDEASGSIDKVHTFYKIIPGLAGLSSLNSGPEIKGLLAWTGQAI
jgi:hypothetical protein